MKILVYAVYLPGSQSPDYIGSHNEQPPPNSAALKWRYDTLLYVGQGTWIDPHAGSIHCMPRLNRSTAWGAALLALSPDQLRQLRRVTLQTVDQQQRKPAELAAIRHHQPPYNVQGRATPEARREKLNAYMRSYRPAYLLAHPDKLDAKRIVDRERARAKRAALKAARQATQRPHDEDEGQQAGR